MNALTRRFELLRYPLIVLVVFIHADNRQVTGHGVATMLHPQGFLANWVREVVSQGVARIAVPLFFAISGYLFFLGFSGEWTEFIRKWKSRSQSLLVPYLAWEILNYGKLWISEGRMPYHASIWAGIDAVLGLTAKTPLVYHLWFIRDLIFYVLLAPLIYLLAKRLPWVGVSVCFAVYLLSTSMDFSRPNPEGVCYFFLGAVLGLRNWQGLVVDAKRYLWIGIWLVLLLVDSLDTGHIWSDYLHKISLMAGCLALLALSGMLEATGGYWQKKLVVLSGVSFFLYLTHEPFLRIIRFYRYSILPHGGDSGAYVLYVVPALMTIMFLTTIYFWVVRPIPLLHRLFAGGR